MSHTNDIGCGARGSAAARRVALSAGFLMLLNGCGSTVHFAGQSTVANDGTLNRSARFSYSGTGSGDFREYLVEHYQLPEGGRWQVYEEKLASPDEEGSPIIDGLMAYAHQATYRPGTPVPADFIRKGEAGGTATNQISLTAADYFFVQTFHYQERFHDVVTADTIRARSSALYRLWLDAVATKAAGGGAPALSPEAVRAALQARFDPWYERVMAGVEQEGMAYLDSAELERATTTLLDEDLVAQYLAEALARQRPDELPTGEWREQIRDALDLDALPDLPDEAEAEILEGLFGAHGLALFRRYLFEITLRLPGDIYESNAMATADGALQWSFNNEQFILQDRVLQARSRIVHRGRIIGASIVIGLLLALSAGTLLWRRRQPGGDLTAHQ